MISRLLSAAAVLWVLGFALFAVSLGQRGEDRHTDGIVVLTGGANRIPHALDLLRAKRAGRLLVSGVDRQVRGSELARENGASAALFRCCVDLGREAVDTRSNADETARWLRDHRYRSVRLVTTDWHMARARFELSHALGADGGPPVLIVSDGVRSDPSLIQLVTEYQKYLLRRTAVLLGW